VFIKISISSDSSIERQQPSAILKHMQLYFTQVIQYIEQKTGAQDG
jgi:hypothetical protein